MADAGDTELGESGTPGSPEVTMTLTGSRTELHSSPMTARRPGPGRAFPNTTSCTEYLYNHADHRTKVTYPNGQKIELAYDGSSRLFDIHAKDSGGSTIEPSRTAWMRCRCLTLRPA